MDWKARVHIPTSGHCDQWQR